MIHFPILILKIAKIYTSVKNIQSSCCHLCQEDIQHSTLNPMGVIRLDSPLLKYNVTILSLTLVHYNRVAETVC